MCKYCDGRYFDYKRIFSEPLDDEINWKREHQEKFSESLSLIRTIQIYNSSGIYGTRRCFQWNTRGFNIHSLAFMYEPLKPGCYLRHCGMDGYVNNIEAVWDFTNVTGIRRDKTMTKPHHGRPVFLYKDYLPQSVYVFRYSEESQEPFQDTF